MSEKMQFVRSRAVRMRPIALAQMLPCAFFVSILAAWSVDQAVRSLSDSSTDFLVRQLHCLS